MQQTDPHVGDEAVAGHFLQVDHRVDLDHALVVNDVRGHQDEADRGREPGDLEDNDDPTVLLTVYVVIVQIRSVDYHITNHYGDRLDDMVNEQ